MKYSTRMSDTTHLLAAIQIVREVAERTGKDLKHLLSSAAIARSLHTNPAYVRKLMVIASRAGLLVTKKGKANPELSRTASEISLLDIYRAVEGDNRLLKLDTHINPECNVGKAIQFSLGDAYDEIQRAAEKAMAEISLQDVIEGYYSRMGRDALPD